MRFDIVMYINAEGVDTSSISNVHRLPLIYSLAENMRGTGKVLVVTHYVSLLLAPLLQPRRFLNHVAHSSAQQLEKNLFVYTPSIPLNLVVAEKVPLLLRMCQRYLGRSVKKALEASGFSPESPRVMWATHPFHLYYESLIEESLILYECYDDFPLEYGEKRNNNLMRLEESLARKSRIILATSRSLYERLKKTNANTCYFPNAVDFKLFNQAVDPETEIPNELLAIPRPIIGFMGELYGPWNDLDLLREVVSRKADWSFVFIGYIDPGTRRLAKPLMALPNAFFLGWRDYYSLPSYLKGFDVAIMPYKTGDFMQSVNPNKMYQLMATGVSIVSTPIPEILRFTSVIEVGDDVGSFIAAIERCLGRKDQTRRMEQITIARRESWDERTKMVVNMIRESLREKHDGNSSGEKVNQHG